MRQRRPEKEGCTNEELGGEKKEGRAGFHLLLRSVLITEQHHYTPTQPGVHHLNDPKNIN